MSLKLMYITNRTDVAEIAQANGVDRIFVDMEYIGKEERQGGVDSVKNSHTIADVKAVRSVLNKTELLVRVNPIHDATESYCSSEDEIDAAIQAGADIIMLPMAKKPEELRRFVCAVGGRVKTMFLLETAEASENIEEMLAVEGIDEIHIGLNDLHLSMNMKFMFELLCDGTVEHLCNLIREKGIPYGFGGIARLGYGMLPAENVITEHYRLGSSMAILSRSFCNADKISDASEIAEVFSVEMKKIRELEKEVAAYTHEQFAENQKEVAVSVEKIVKRINEGA